MNQDEIIDALAFGAATQKIGNCLGMYLGPELIYIAETHLDKGKLVVDHLVRIPVPAAEPAKGAAGPTTATLNTDFLTDNAKISALIRQSMSQVRWNTKDVIVTLSHHLGLLRYFAMPAVDKRFWKSAVPLEAKKYIPIPFDVLSHDYQVAPLPPDAAGKARQGALVAVTQKKNLANIGGLLQSLGLRLVGMEVAPCSALRLFESLDKNSAGKTHCQVHFDGGNIRIVLADKGMPVFFRELFLGTDASLGDFRKVDLGGCVAFAQKQLGVGNLSQLRVSGTTPTLAQWAEAFTQEVGSAAKTQDVAAQLGIKGGDWGGYASIGASLRTLEPTTLTLDLGKVGKITDEERRTARAIIAILGAIAIYFGAVGTYNKAVYKYEHRELDGLKREADIEAVLKNRPKDDIDNLLRGMQGQLDMAGNFNPQSTMKATAVIQDVVNSLPDKVWITGLAFTNPIIATGGGAGVQLEIDGHAVAATLGQEQELCREFRERLQKTPVVGKKFADIDITITGKPMTMETNEGMDPATLTKKLEERTSFHLSAKPKKT